MAWFRPLALVPVLMPCMLGACSDDGEPQNADDGAASETGGSASAGTQDPTITTTASTSLTTGTNDTSNDESGDSAETVSASATAAESTGAADGTESLGDTGEASGTTSDDGTSGATDPTGLSGESSGSDGATTGVGMTPVGFECTEDSECVTGVCWDWHDYDRVCSGAICSAECASDQECVELATEAAAPFPENVFCGDDGLCVFLESGLGGWVCESRG